MNPTFQMFFALMQVCLMSWMGMAVAELTGKIDFLKGGEAEEYEGISIDWIKGTKASLTIYEDGEKKEKLDLYHLQTKEEMHALFQEKGFHRKSDVALQEEKRIKIVKEQLEKEESVTPVFSKLFTFYGVVGCVVVLVVGFLQTRRKKVTRKGNPLPVRV